MKRIGIVRRKTGKNHGAYEACGNGRVHEIQLSDKPAKS